jgi:hypothetical protein
MFCKDDATTYLKRLGYNTVRHPREGIRPLDIIGRQGSSVKYLGHLKKLIKNAPRDLPPIREDQTAGDINGNTSSKLAMAVGVNILGSILGAMGGNAGVTTHYEGARTIQFSFSNVKYDDVELFDVGNYLNDGEVDARNLILAQYVLGNGSLYVITKTIKTNKVSVTAEARDRGSVAVDVPAIQGVVGGDIKVSQESGSEAKVSFEGNKMLTFGFQCYEIGIIDGVITMVDSRPGAVAMVAIAREAGNDFEPALLVQHGVLDITMSEDSGGADA